MDSGISALRVGDPYPSSDPKLNSEGCLFDISEDGRLTFFILFPNINPKEEKIISNGFSRWALTEYNAAGITLAIIVLKHSGGMYLEGILHAGLYPDGRCQTFLESEGNILTTFVLDRRIIKMMRMSGLDKRGVNKLQGIVRRQLAEPISHELYQEAVSNVFSSLTQKQLFERGTSYAHREIRG